MDVAQFTKPCGTLIRTIEGYDAFVPAPLPPKLDHGKLVKPLVQAAQHVAELKGASRRLPNPHILIKPLQRREALTSSAMEGTYSTLDNILLDEAGLNPEQRNESREVGNYVRALQIATEKMTQLPISHRLIKEAHAQLLRGLSDARGANKLPGQYKQSQNMIGGINPKTARYVPPPPPESQVAMDTLEAYINRKVKAPDEKLLDLALTHYQFEAIHPFADGNGRVGRMLITLQALQLGLIDQPVLYASPALERKKDEYIDRMFDVSTKSEWENWIAFFLDAVTESCKESIVVIDKVISLQKEYRQRAPSIGRSVNLLQVIDCLFDSPVTTIPRVQKQLGVSPRAANLIVKKLVSAGILHELIQGHPSIYVAQEIRNVSSP